MSSTPAPASLSDQALAIAASDPSVRVTRRRHVAARWGSSSPPTLPSNATPMLEAQAAAPAPDAAPWNAPTTPPAPPPPQPLSDERLDPEQAQFAAATLGCFSALTAIALLAWFSAADAPWTWQSLIALLGALFGAASGGLVYRERSRLYLKVGVGVMAFSLLRVGPPSSWTLATWLLVVMTGLFLVPLVRILRGLAPR